jgi:rifampicin phosphotransferase
MGTASVRPLREVGLGDAAEVGRKAASLGGLMAAGFRVPEGMVIVAGIADLAADERRSLVDDVARGLGPGSYAVRSSGVAEDGEEHSFAGVYESELDVPMDALPAAVERVLASARAARAVAYGPAIGGPLAVIVQRMVRPVVAGVALTADPISGDRRACIVTAVRGTGERLVSGAALGDEWVVRGGTALARRRPEAALGRRDALRVAGEARRIAALRGAPQDVEWALGSDGTAWVLQARPMTALPPDVSWEAPAPGAYTRALRFGEWIAEPVTPLFESWLLAAMEDRVHARLREWIGQHAPRPYHVVVNGWYFYSINFLSGRALARSLPDILWHLVRSPRRVAGVVPPTVRHSVPVFEREWREDLLPRYRAAVARAEGRIGDVPAVELPPLIDELAGLAGDYFASIAALTGAAYKMEMNLAGFHRRHLGRALGGGHLPLLSGLAPPAEPGRHAVASLDWWHPPVPNEEPGPPPPGDHAPLVERRRAAEAAALEALASSPRRLRTFRRLLAETQHLVIVREEQVRDLTLAWPAMRQAVLRIGEALADRSVLPVPDDVFFLSRAEVIDALRGEGAATPIDVSDRRALRDEQARLVPPLLVGHPGRALRWMWDRLPRLIGAAWTDHAIVSGAPASPGRATGPVRVIRGPHEFAALLPGEVLVAPLTAPAWTTLFARAAAVVTDVGSAASHASIVAREYGIPAVVGCGDATARLRTGMVVTVDGSSGNVEPA